MTKIMKSKIWLIENRIVIFNLLFVTNTSPDKNSIWDLIIDFYQIWPPFQWVTSILTLILTYWISGYYYNKFLSKKGAGWISPKARIIMILLDLVLNFGVGIYYMGYRDTFIGELMLRCPVFCSPIFWFLELVCFYIYYKYLTVWKTKI